MTLEYIVYQGLGEASMCWSEIPNGVFDSERAKQIGDAIMAAIREEYYVSTDTVQGDTKILPIPLAERAKEYGIALPNPTEEQLYDPLFTAIWEVIKSWDINVPEYYQGYCGGNGSHVMLIYNAIMTLMVKEKQQ